jgi:hypothetical protein
MEQTTPWLAPKFAEHISRIFALPEHRSKFREISGEEHKVLAPLIQEQLAEFLNMERQNECHPDFHFDWEGNKRKEKKQERSYRVLGTDSFPDAAVLRPFKCAFEFDREIKQASSSFKDALMKASVHVLSGRYEACVFVYILKTGDSKMYLDDESEHTNKLLNMLQEHGLYISIIAT